METKYKRILLKVSGEALAGEKKTGLDYEVIPEICKAIKKCVDAGVEVGIVVGGGNFWRGRSSGAMDRTRADHIGMLATAMNSLALADVLESLGGADVCYGGLGINGHIAFNEAAEKGDPITCEEFAALGSRVLPITRETKAINGAAYLSGDIEAMPKWCITIGMKQILAAKRIYIQTGAAWHPGVIRRVLSEKPQPQIPATLLQLHDNAAIYTSERIAKQLYTLANGRN